MRGTQGLRGLEAHLVHSIELRNEGDRCSARSNDLAAQADVVHVVVCFIQAQEVEKASHQAQPAAA